MLPGFMENSILLLGFSATLLSFLCAAKLTTGFASTRMQRKEEIISYIFKYSICGSNSCYGLIVFVVVIHFIYRNGMSNIDFYIVLMLTITSSIASSIFLHKRITYFIDKLYCVNANERIKFRSLDFVAIQISLIPSIIILIRSTSIDGQFMPPYGEETFRNALACAPLVVMLIATQRRNRIDKVPAQNIETITQRVEFGSQIGRRDFNSEITRFSTELSNDKSTHTLILISSDNKDEVGDDFDQIMLTSVFSIELRRYFVAHIARGELAVFLPYIDASSASAIADQIRRRAGSIDQYSIGIGAVSSASQAGALQAHARTAVYLSVLKGGGCTEIWPPPHGILDAKDFI